MASGELTRGTVTTRDIVARLWGLCNVLRDDGVTYNEYVTELTFLLFLKMMAETGHEDRLPNDYRWDELAKREAHMNSYNSSSFVGQSARLDNITPKKSKVC